MPFTTVATVPFSLLQGAHSRKRRGGSREGVWSATGGGWRKQRTAVQSSAAQVCVWVGGWVHAVPVGLQQRRLT